MQIPTQAADSRYRITLRDQLQRFGFGFVEKFEPSSSMQRLCRERIGFQKRIDHFRMPVERRERHHHQPARRASRHDHRADVAFDVHLFGRFFVEVDQVLTRPLKIRATLLVAFETQHGNPASRMSDINRVHRIRRGALARPVHDARVRN